MEDQLNCLRRLLYKIGDLMEFYATQNGNYILLLGTNRPSNLQYSNNPRSITSSRLSDVYIGFFKCYLPYCNNIDKLLINIQILFLKYIKSTSRIITQDIIKTTVT